MWTILGILKRMSNTKTFSHPSLPSDKTSILTKHYAMDMDNLSFHNDNLIKE